MTRMVSVTPLIQRPALAFYSVFLFLTGMALGDDLCLPALRVLFYYIQKEAIWIEDGPTLFPYRIDYFFVPEGGLIDMLDSLRRRLGSQRQNQAIVLPSAEFHIETDGYRSLKFFIKHPDSMNIATGKAVCIGADCDKTMDILQGYWNPETSTLSCLKQVGENRFFISANEYYGINIDSLLLGTKHGLFGAYTVLQKLIKASKSQGAAEGRTLTLYDHSGLSTLVVRLPTKIPPVIEEYIAAAIQHFNTYQKPVTFATFDATPARNTGFREQTITKKDVNIS